MTRPSTNTIACSTAGCTGKHGPKSKTGLCRRCFLSRHEERRLAALRAYGSTDQAKVHLTRAAKLRHQRSVEWCPPEYLEQYRWLTRRNSFSRVKCADAKRMILDQIATDRRRAEAARKAMSFEDRLAAVVATGQINLVAATPRLHLTPTIRRAA